MNEGELIKAMHDDFKSQHLAGFWRKIHGDRYMAGMPDVLCALPDVAALCEFKWEDRDKWLMMPFDAMVKENLTGLQAAELKMLAISGATCPLRARVLIGFPVETDTRQFEMACGFDMDDLDKYKHFTACDLANVAVHAKLADAEKWRDKWQFPFPAPVGMEMQLRATPSKEQWRVGALVLGLRRYKVFDVRTHIDQADETIFED